MLEQMHQIHKITKEYVQILSKLFIDSYFIYAAFSYQTHNLNSSVYKNKSELNIKNKSMWTHF